MLTTLRRTTRTGTAAVVRLTVLATALLVGFFRVGHADRGVDDRGSDSTEKALMIALGVTVGGIVVAAATLLVTNLSSKF